MFFIVIPLVINIPESKQNPAVTPAASVGEKIPPYIPKITMKIAVNPNYACPPLVIVFLRSNFINVPQPFLLQTI